MSAQLSDKGLKRTALFECHRSLGGRFVEFGGWEMPVQFSGVVDEHEVVRRAVGLFDVSHMGEVRVRGGKALEFLQRVTSNDVSRLSVGQAQYSLMLNERGGVVDDIIVYRLGAEDYLLCVNAGNTEKGFSWLVRQNEIGANLENVSSEYAQIAVQGPKAVSLMARLIGVREEEFSFEKFPAFCVRSMQVSGGTKLKDSRPVLVARTGYTGEDGFEVFCTNEQGPEIWFGMLDVGKDLGAKPCGLGARDTLRLEACFPLHGHELSDDLSALSCGVGWVVKFQKGEFIGKEALLRDKEQGLPRKLCGFFVLDPGIVREGAKIFDGAGKEVGWASSGTKTPTVGRALGLCFVEATSAEDGTELFAEVRGKKLKIQLAKIPFYKRGK